MYIFEKYNNATVANASQYKQLIFIFDEILKLLQQASHALEHKNYETKYKALTKVIDVFYILKSGIELEKCGDDDKMIYKFYESSILYLEDLNNKADTAGDLDVITESIKEVRISLLSSIQSGGEKNNEQPPQDKTTDIQNSQESA